MKKISFILIVIILLATKSFSQTWAPVGSGINGQVYALGIYNGELIAAGNFLTAGGVSAANIAKWNGSSWSPLGSGLNLPVYALVVYGNELIVGGWFYSAGGISANRIAKWNGSSWSPLGSGMNGDVYALSVYGPSLIAGGYFTNAGGVSTNYIAKWNGSVWSPLGSGLGGFVHTLNTYGGSLIAGGEFTTAGGNSANGIAKWNGSAWDSLGHGLTGNYEPWARALTVYNADLIAGGSFWNAGGVYVNYIAKWNGNTWGSLSSGMGGGSYPYVFALAVYGNKLIAGGNFLTAGGISTNYIAKWNGSAWDSLAGGMTGSPYPGVHALTVYGTDLIAAGRFTTAGGISALNIARWTSEQSLPTPPVLVSPADNSQNQPTTIQLIWFKSQNAVSYRVQLSTDSLFNSLVINDSTVIDTTRTISGLQNLTYYWWRVNAKNNSGTSQYSAVWNFRTIVSIPPAPILISPENGASGQSLTPLLDWFVVSGAASYRIQVTTDSAFTTINTLDSSNVTGDSLRIPNGRLSNNVKYFWRVNATNAGGTGPWSAVWNFRVGYIGSIRFGNEIPNEYTLYNNYPNPFNPVSKIKFDIPISNLTLSGAKGLFVNLIIYDILGREVSTIVNAQLNPGTYEAEFDGTNYPSGVYFYKLVTESFVQTRKMVLIK